MLSNRFKEPLRAIDERNQLDQSIMTAIQSLDREPIDVAE